MTNYDYEYNNDKGFLPELGDKSPQSLAYNYKTCSCWLCGILRDKIAANAKGYDGWITSFGNLVPLTILVPQYHLRHVDSLYNVHKTGNVNDDMEILLSILSLDLSAFLVGYRYPHIKKLLDAKNLQKSLKSQGVAHSGTY